MKPDWITDVLHFWFDELTPEQWFRGGPSVDESIRTRFTALHEELRRSVPEKALASPEGALAAVIVLDQFPRNIYRDHADSFAADAAALKLAEAAIARGYDQTLSPEQRQFLYLPFQHSEDLAMQDRSCDLYRALGLEQPLAFAEKHRAVVARFGRFPHRNAVLGRASTPEEVEFMKQGRGF